MILVGQKENSGGRTTAADVHLRLVAVDVINGSLNGGDFLSFFVRNLNIKLFFQSHYQLNSVKRIRPHVFNERSIVGNFFLLNAQLFADNFVTRSSIVLILLNFLSKLAFAMVFVVYKMLKNLQLNPGRSYHHFTLF